MLRTLQVDTREMINMTDIHGFLNGLHVQLRVMFVHGLLCLKKTENPLHDRRPGQISLKTPFHQKGTLLEVDRVLGSVRLKMKVVVEEEEEVVVAMALARRLCQPCAWIVVVPSHPGS